MQKVFIISDPHGHYTVTKKAVDDAGFDPENENHHLLCLGDYFDRGKENVEVFEYLHELGKKGKASFILGNHDLFMLEFLEGKHDKVAFNAVYNGFDQTLSDFSGITYKPGREQEVYERIMKRHPELYEWLASMPLYIERDHYIFTHGGIDTTLPDWRKQDRHGFVWNYQSRLPKLEGKTIVVGHERTAQIRMRRGTSISPEDDSIYDVIEDDGVIYIDPFVEMSKRMNVYIVHLENPL